MRHFVKTAALFAAYAVAAYAVAAFSLAVPTLAHEAPCPYCKQTIVQDNDKQDNETVLKAGRKRIEYKCVFCALREAKTDYEGDLTILAPSEIKGEPIKLQRAAGQWTAASDGVRFVAQKADHKICQVTYRAFTTEKSAQDYIAANKAQLPDAQLLTLAQMLDIVSETK